jgi:hypothetical protein
VGDPSTLRGDKRPSASKAQALGWFALLLWTLSLFIPAVRDGQTEIIPGYAILAIGWLGVLMLQFGWFANIVFIYTISRILLGYRTSILWGLCLLALLISSVYWAYFGSMIYDNGSRPINERFAGFYFWVASMATTALVSIIDNTVRGSRERS